MANLTWSFTLDGWTNKSKYDEMNILCSGPVGKYTTKLVK